MNPEFHRCVYCEHLASLDRWTDACAEAFQAARDAGLPVAGRALNGRALLPLDISGEEAGRLCGAFSLLPRKALAREFCRDLAEAAYADDEDDGRPDACPDACPGGPPPAPLSFAPGVPAGFGA